MSGMKGSCYLSFYCVVIMVTKYKSGFTLIELLVVISIIALLLAILMPSLGKARNLAMIASCSGQLKQWGVVCSQYANENNNMFWQGHWGDPQPAQQNDQAKMWMCVMWKYYLNPEFTYCPAAKIQNSVGDSASGNSDRAWGGTQGLGWCKMPKPGVRDKNGNLAYWAPKGSYGENSWVANKTGSYMDANPKERAFYWRSRDIRGGNEVPMLGDSSWIDGWIFQNATPPQYKDAHGDDNMWRICIDRHKGKDVWLFVDGSVKGIGIKELFTLTWHRGYKSQSNPYTWRYYSGSVGNPSSLWPAWMKGFKEYMDK
jgi:prepilin-type N-terminal cleavage/methylation domain-containing protein